MHSFQWIQWALGVIVALGMTRILLSTVHMGLARHTVKLDWVPFVWATNIFFLLLQFSWMFVSLDGVVKTWRFAVFFALLCFVVTLFVAAALVLPNTEAQAGTDLRDWFGRDGRWALPFLATYAFLAYPFNWYFDGAPAEENQAAGLIVLLSFIAFFTKSRRVLTVTTFMVFVITVLIVIQMILYS